MSKVSTDIKQALEKLYRKYNRWKLIKPDPLQFVYQYAKKADMEITGILAAVLAYGRVEQIEKSVTELLSRMGNSPYEFVRTFNKSKREKLKNFKHRFNTGDDISDLLELLRKVIDKFSSVEELFLQGYNRNDKNIIPALSTFCDTLLSWYASAHKDRISKGLAYLLPRPEKNSACKRLNLFLRWMVRNDDVDPGLWKSIDKAKLIVPVDVHMGRLCRILGLYNHKTVSLRAALKITDSFAEFSPTDPVKYDFALSRVGIIEDCTGRLRTECENCELFVFCREKIRKD